MIPVSDDKYIQPIKRGVSPSELIKALGGTYEWPDGVPEYNDADLVQRAMMNAKPRHTGSAHLWAAVVDTFGVGSTVAVCLCRKHGLDPEKEVNGARCFACEP